MIVTVCAICNQTSNYRAHMDGAFQSIHRVKVERLARLKIIVTSSFKLPVPTSILLTKVSIEKWHTTTKQGVKEACWYAVRTMIAAADSSYLSLRPGGTN